MELDEISLFCSDGLWSSMNITNTDDKQVICLAVQAESPMIEELPATLVDDIGGGKTHRVLFKLNEDYLAIYSDSVDFASI